MKKNIEYTSGLRKGKRKKIRKRIEVVITGTIGNRVVFTGSGVRIPSLPPQGNNTNTETKSEFVLFFSNDYFGVIVERVKA